MVISLTPERQAATSCNPTLSLPPWTLDAPLPAHYGPGASQDDAIPANAPVQAALPAAYRAMDAAELDARIRRAKELLGSRLLILGHHYQRDEIICYADLRGDSFKLSQQAAARPEADYLVFCGVHFMAESADILSQPHQQVVLPNMAAGCSMADMAHPDDVLDAWDALSEVYDPASGARAPIIPVTYMNSAAALKAFCGENGGIVCTSSNAERVLDWALERGERVLFFPDQHLGRNTGYAMGIPLDQMVVWNPRKPLGGNTPEALRNARLVLWRGHCSVHKRASPWRRLSRRAVTIPASTSSSIPNASCRWCRQRIWRARPNTSSRESPKARPARSGQSAPRSAWYAGCSRSIPTN
jgi:quinolinate synthase